MGSRPSRSCRGPRALWRHALGLFSLVFGSACAGPSPQTSRGAAPIHNGTVDERPEHLAVVALQGGIARCSGTLIAPRFVVTATHCLGATSSVGFGNDWSSSEMKWVNVEAVVSALPDAQWFDGTDFSLLKLRSGPPFPVTPIPALPAALGLTRDDLEKTVTMVGFGYDENGISGIKRFVDVPLLDVRRFTGSGGPVAIASFHAGNGFGDHGDSGGPWIIDRDGVKYVAVVTTYPSEGTIVDAFESLRLGFMAGAPGERCGLEADCESGACIDGVCCESPCEGPCRSCTQRGLEGSCRPVGPEVSCGAGRVCSGGVCCDRACEGPCESCTQAGSIGICAPAQSGLTCDDGDKCTSGSICIGGECRGRPKSCPVENDCRAPQGCDPATGACRPSAPKRDGTPCRGRDACSLAECRTGRCAETGTRACPALDECHEASSCVPADGGCALGAPKDGVACDGGTCRAGVCRPSASGCGAAGESDGFLAVLAALLFLYMGGGRRLRRRRPDARRAL